jgi:hypothetical protein
MMNVCENYSHPAEGYEAEVYSETPKKTMVVLRCTVCDRRVGLRMVRKAFVSIADMASCNRNR